LPNRILREGILTSSRIAKLGWAEEVFYRRLHSVVDDFGRYFADQGLLRAACYPRQLNKVSDSDIGKWLTVLVEAALVRVYPAQDGERYLELLDFRQQVRAKESKFPNPLSTCVADAQQQQSSAHLGVSVSVSEDGGESRASAASAPSKKPKQTGLPADFCISERVRKWAKEKGYGQLEAHFEAFVSKAKAKAYTYADWDEGFMGAVRDDWAEMRKGDGKAAGRHTDSAEDTARMLDARNVKAAKPSPEVQARMDAILKGKVYQ
jgi:hypothetical protein